MTSTCNTTWPVLTSHDAAHLSRIALPLGGIGTGTVSLGGRGDLRDWEIVNRPAKGFSPKNAFFALWTRKSEDRRQRGILSVICRLSSAIWLGALS